VARSALAVVLIVACSSAPEDAVRGVVVDVQGSLDEIESFTVLVDGQQMVFVPTEEGDYAFPLGHLRDHLRGGEPVLVGFEEQDDRLVATFIDDG
jgi:hypothetical protein